MTKISELHRRWSKDADFKNAYHAFGEEFDLARILIEARTAEGLSRRSDRWPLGSRRDRVGRSVFSFTTA